MAVSPFYTHDQGFLLALSGQESFTSLRCVLITAAHTPNRATDVTFADVIANECQDTGYFRQYVGGEILNLVGTDIVLDHNRVIFAEAATVAAKYVYYLFWDAADNNASPILGHIDLNVGGGNISSFDGMFSFRPNYNGLFRITRTEDVDPVGTLVDRLFLRGEDGAFFYASQGDLYTDEAGTTPAGAGDPVRLWTDLSPNSLDATSSANDQTMGDDGGVIYVDHTSGSLSVNLPDLGTDATRIVVTWDNVDITGGLTISGATTLPTENVEAVVYLNRPLSGDEVVNVQNALGGNVWDLSDGVYDGDSVWRDIGTW